MPGRVDEVDLPVAPLAGDGRRVDRDPALLLFFVEVGDRGPLVDVPHAVRGAGIEQDPFGGGRLTRVDMGNDADIADEFDRGGHATLPREVRERLVRVRHAVDVVALGHRGPFALVGGHQLFGQQQVHRPPLLLAAGFEHPANRQGLLPTGADLRGNLVVGPADAPRTNFDRRLDVVDRLVEHVDRRDCRGSSRRSGPWRRRRRAWPWSSCRCSSGS